MAAVGVSAWLLLKSFASGCTAMTGVEAVSNGVTAFREPVAKTAQRTLTAIIAILIVLLAGIAVLCRAYQIGATIPGPGYQSVLSQLTAAVVGRHTFYFVTIGSILLVLSLSANTAFADFPRLCRLVAEDGYLPTPLAVRGRRLVYTVGIITLGILCAILLILFRGITDRLIPLYAVGAFLAFTLSQAGMVAHWKRKGGPGSRLGMYVNGLGAAATAGTVAIVTITKFTDGAWITAVLIPMTVISMYSIRRHYDSVTRELENPAPLSIAERRSPIVVVPMLTLNKLIREGLQFALNLSSDVTVVHVECAVDKEEILRHWNKVVAEPLKRSGLPVPQLKFLNSPYRFIIYPIVEYVARVAEQNPGREIAVIIPELEEKHWYHYFLHNQRAAWLKAALLRKGSPNIVVISVPWYLGT
jgi:hypothetical protein